MLIYRCCNIVYGTLQTVILRALKVQYLYYVIFGSVISYITITRRKESREVVTSHSGLETKVVFYS